LLSLPSDDWEILQWGCPEVKFNMKAKRTKKPSCNLLLHSALWIEVRDEDFWDEEKEVIEEGKCSECDNFIGQKGRYFLPSVKVKLFESESNYTIDESLEMCLSEKILELAVIRPIFRFSVLDFHFTVESLQSYFQFGNGQKYKNVEPRRKYQIRRC